jgi:hypothetical protein
MLTKAGLTQVAGGAWFYGRGKSAGAAFDSATPGVHFSKSYAFDAASGSGMAFLASQLELPDTNLVEPLAAVTHPRDMIIKSGGGYVEYTSRWAVDYATTGGNQYGLQGTENTQIPMVQANIIKGTWPVIPWQATQMITFIDLQRLIDAKRLGIPAPVSIQQVLDDGVKLIWGKALDRLTYLGWANQPGLINNTNVSYSLAAPGGGGFRAWSKKNTTEILNDINTVLLSTQQNSGYDIEGMADSILVDFEHWSLLNQPMTIGGFNSALEYILANNVARRQGVDLTILPLPDNWISTQGTGTSSRMVAYKKVEKSLYLTVAQPIQKVMTVPTVSKGGAYETLFSGALGVVALFRPTTVEYLDAI